MKKIALNIIEVNLLMHFNKIYKLFSLIRDIWYWVNTYKFITMDKLVFETTKGLHLSLFEAHDIDTIDDWNLAELNFDFLQSIK